MSFPRYDRDGDTLVLTEGPESLRTVRVRDTLALMFDAEEGVLFRHGHAEGVRSYFDKVISRAGGTPLTDALHLVEFPVDQVHGELLHSPVLVGAEQLDEVNRVISISGYAATFAMLLQPSSPGA